MLSDETISKIISSNPKLKEKYSSLNEWNDDPEKEYMIADFYSKGYMVLSCFSWVLCLIFYFLTILYWVQRANSSLIGFGIPSVILTIFALFMTTSYHKFKKMYDIEYQRYQDAKIKKQLTYTTIKRNYLDSINLVFTSLETCLKESDEFEELIPKFNFLIYTTENSYNFIEKEYKDSKIYTFNVNEIFSIEAYRDVDCFMEYEIITITLKEFIATLRQLQLFCERNMQDEFAKTYELLLSFRETKV